MIGMVGTAALGLHLLGAGSAGPLGPMTAAVVALGAGGSVTPSGEVSAFGSKGVEIHTALQITPLGVSLVGALLLSWFFLRSLRTAGTVISPAELLARAGAVMALFTAMLGGLAWAGHGVVALDEDVLEPGGGPGGVGVPGLDGLGDIGGLLPGGIGELIGARPTAGFAVDTAPTLLGGLGWSAGILLIALLASRRTPLPRGWDAVHRVVRPAVSAVVTVVLIAVAAGAATAAYTAAGDDRPRRVLGAALLGMPNGVWLGVPVGLFVPFDGRATGEPAGFLPAPLDRILSVSSDQPVTLSRLAGLDGRMWLLGVAAALLMLLAGVLTAVRTPVEAGQKALGLAGRCALRLGIVTALTLPLLAWLTEVSVDASLSVLGFELAEAGVELHGRPGAAVLLGAVWGAGAGAAGALMARSTGAAGLRAAPLARGDMEGGRWAEAGGGPAEGAGHGPWAAAGEARRPGRTKQQAGPSAPGTPRRPPLPSTTPYLRLPGDPRSLDSPEDARPPDGRGQGGKAAPSGRTEPGSGGRPRPGAAADDLYGAPTVIGPLKPPPRPSGRRTDKRPGDGPPPPPPPPPALPPRPPRPPRQPPQPSQPPRPPRPPQQ
ncbi:streptophobe family protein [Streptomyces thermoalcalitolerans]|uniref:Streptophobe family protein n=1 Tax=Streptomyces thermoalcalitolerans TaxID=65605 RepID=A0ABN1NDL8_9ACTN